MKTIKANPITVENFAPYGSFTSIVEPSGNALGNFYNDKVLLPVSGSMPVAFSPLVMDKPDKMIISEVEYHNTTGEGILPVGLLPADGLRPGRDHHGLALDLQRRLRYPQPDHGYQHQLDHRFQVRHGRLRGRCGLERDRL